ncbi:MAG: hypothetical protein ACKVHP_03150 [Verrucomicrobiales bacterium]
MKNLLFVFFIFAGLIAFFTQAMVVASQVNAVFFWLAVLLVIAAMVVIGCWELSDSATNRFGWLFMVIMAAFCILANLPNLGDGLSPLLVIAFFGLYGAVGVLGFIREKGGDHSHAH